MNDKQLNDEELDKLIKELEEEECVNMSQSDVDDFVKSLSPDEVLDLLEANDEVFEIALNSWLQQKKDNKSFWDSDFCHHERKWQTKPTGSII